MVLMGLDTNSNWLNDEFVSLFKCQVHYVMWKNDCITTGQEIQQHINSMRRGKNTKKGKAAKAKNKWKWI